VSVAFVVLAVAALFAVPLVMGRRAADAQRMVTETLDPASLWATRLSMAQALEMSSFQAFIMTGEPEYKEAYDQAIAQENRIYDSLQRLVEGLKLQGVPEKLAALFTDAESWHLLQNPAFMSDENRRAALDQVDAEQARYREIQGRTVELEGAIQDEVDQARAEVAALETLQGRITFGLVLVALLALAAVARVGWNQRVLAGEAQDRRRDAVRARREIDALMEATGDGVIGMDLKAHCTSVNRAGCELLGYMESALKGRDFHEVLHHTTLDGKTRNREESQLLAALSRGERVRSPDMDVLWRRDGTALPVQWSLRPLVDGKELKGAVLTFADMTEIREKEEALRRAVRTRDEVVSIVSHDLRNPLGVVGAAADLLLDLPLDEGERTRQARIIKRSAERMSRLIGDLLDVSRIEAGALVVRRAHEDVGDVLEEARAIFAPQAESYSVALEVQVEPDVPRVMMDRDRMLQALSNLVENALKATPVCGRITLRASASAGDGATISVADTGPGIPEGAMDHLFDRFWQASRQDRTGAGLGLAIVRGIVEAHRGTMSVESQAGRGAVFHIHLPADIEPAAAGDEDGRGTDA
jgi:PAS domain S-box-containing protein